MVELFLTVTRLRLNNGYTFFFSHREGESVAYAGQKAWLLNATMRDNILFDESYNANRSVWTPPP